MKDVTFCVTLTDLLCRKGLVAFKVTRLQLKSMQDYIRAP